MKIDLSQLNRQSESETLELKESFDSKALETVGAFANASGGAILIGVADDGQVRGIQLGHNTLDEWAQKMQAKLQPRFLPAIANAVCHRSYDSIAPTTIRLFDDRVEIWNPGHLPVELTTDDLFKIHNSYSPNHLIATSFYNLRIIERWGSGTLRIAEALAEQGLPKPVFDVSAPNTFKVVMFAKAARKSTESLEGSLSPRQVKALKYLAENEILSNAIYQQLFEASKATASRDLRELVNKGLIVREGLTGKGTIYRLNET
jgi:predicted HTH transcriptional regulator